MSAASLPELLRGFDAVAAPAVAWAATYLIHSTLWLGAALLATRVLRSSELRERVLKGALVAALATATLAGRFDAPGPGGWTLAWEPAASAAARPGPTSAVVAPSGPAVPASAAALASPVEGPPARAAFPLHRWLFAAWLLGALVAATRAALARRRLRAFLRDRSELTGGAMHAALARLCAGAGFRRPARLSASPRLGSPIALRASCGGPAEICVPERALGELAPAEQEGLVAHELAHLVRRDPLWRRGLELARGLLFFQPLHATLARRLEDESELLCDAQAVAWTGGGLALARCLERVAGWLEGAAAPRPAVTMARGGAGLVERVERALERPAPPPTRMQLRGTSALLALGALLFACSGPAVKSQPEPAGIEADAARAEQVLQILRERVDPEGVFGDSLRLEWLGGARYVVRFPDGQSVSWEDPEQLEGSANEIRVLAPELEVVLDVEREGERFDVESAAAWSGEGPFRLEGRRLRLELPSAERAPGEDGTYRGPVFHLDPAQLSAETRLELARTLSTMTSLQPDARLRLDARPGILYADVELALELLGGAGFTEVEIDGRSVPTR